MAKERFIYVEPASYFSDDMLEEAEAWEREHAEEERKKKEAKKNKEDKKPR
jgi:hypothetical protein|nr:MAG TPA_asm: hypothetical protein [Caudoviricetes sp.]